jgi:CheY-like chemotaxis protein
MAATAAIRARCSATELSIIGMSSRPAPADLADGRSAGMNECIGKPDDLDS